MSHELHKRLTATQVHGAGCIPASILAEASTASPHGNSPSTDRLWDVVTRLVEANAKHAQQIKELQGAGRASLEAQLEPHLKTLMQVARGMGTSPNAEARICWAVKNIRDIIRN